MTVPQCEQWESSRGHCCMAVYAPQIEKSWIRSATEPKALRSHPSTPVTAFTQHASVSSTPGGIRYGAFALKISSEIDPASWIAIGDRIRSKPFLPPSTENPNVLSRTQGPPRRSQVKAAPHQNAAKTKWCHQSSCSEGGRGAFRHRLRRSSQTSFRVDDGRLLWQCPHRTPGSTAPRSGLQTGRGTDSPGPTEARHSRPHRRCRADWKLLSARKASLRRRRF